MTYGALKLRLTQMFPGVSLDLIEGWVADRYSDILAELDWSRLEVQSTLLTTAPYTTGTVTATAGSNAVTGSGTTWTAAMTGRFFRVTGRDEVYTFTYASATTGTLDRPFEGTTAAALAYSIFQSVYTLPANCRLLQDDAFSSSSLGQLTRLSHGQLNRSAPTRATSGTPLNWTSYMDDSSTPPLMQVELYPYPDTAVGLRFSYIADAAALSSTSTTLQVWLQPAALIEGVSEKALRHLKDYTGAALAKAEAAESLNIMKRAEARRIGPARMQISDYYSSHRTKRWSS